MGFFALGFWLRDELPDVAPGVLFIVPAGGAIAVYVCWRVIRARQPDRPEPPEDVEKAMRLRDWRPPKDE